MERTRSALTRGLVIFKLRKIHSLQANRQRTGRTRHAFSYVKPSVLVTSVNQFVSLVVTSNMSSSEDGSDYQTQMTYGSGFKTRSISKVRSIFSFITVEPVVFLYALGFSLTMVITPVLYFEKTCKVSLKFKFIAF